MLNRRVLTPIFSVICSFQSLLITIQSEGPFLKLLPLQLSEAWPQPDRHKDCITHRFDNTDKSTENVLYFTSPYGSKMHRNTSQQWLKWVSPPLVISRAVRISHLHSRVLCL